MKNTTNKHLIKNSIFTILFILLLLLTSFLDPFTSNAGTATYITKNKTFNIYGCEDGSTIRFFCQLDKNNALSDVIGRSQITATSCDLDRGKSAITVTWQTPVSAGSNPLGGSFKCSYRSSTNVWTIQMINVNCFTYTPYIICNAGTKIGYRTSTIVSTIAGNGTKAETGVDTNGDYDIVNLTATHQGQNSFKVYLGAGFADNGFTFNWKAKTYYVTYDGNGATSGVPAKQSFAYNSGTKLSTTKPVKTGYTFAYWTGSGNIIGSSFAPGASIPKDWGSFTLKAVWTPKVYTITLNKQSGTGGHNAVCVKYNTGKYTTTACTTSIPLQVTIPTRTGYTFGGYYTGQNGTGTQLIDSVGKYTTTFTNVYFKNDSTIYAKWTPKKYTITTNHVKYNPMTETWEFWKKSTAIVEYDKTYSVEYLTPDEGYITQSKTENFIVKGDATVEAKYYPKQYKVLLNYTGGQDKNKQSSTTDIINWMYASTIGTDISEYGLTRQGYTFTGWNLQDLDTSILVYGTDNLIIKNTKYFDLAGMCRIDATNGSSYLVNATWEAKKYNILFDYNYESLGFPTKEAANILVNGKDELIEKKEVEYDNTVGELPLPTILGATYVEWNTKPDGSGDTYTSETIYKVSEDITVYAIWKRISFNIEYNSNYKGRENTTYKEENLLSNEKITIKDCTECNFGVKNNNRQVIGDEMNYIIMPEGCYYYVANDTYYKFVGYSVDETAIHTCIDTLYDVGEEIDGYKLQYMYQAYNNLKEEGSLAGNSEERTEVIMAEYDSLISINAPITEFEIKINAIWDEYPILTLKTQTLYQESVKNMDIDAFSNVLREFINAELTTDKEDSDYNNGKLAISFPNIEVEKAGMEELKNSGAVSVTYELTDTYGNKTRKTKSIAIISKYPEDPIDPENPTPRELTIRCYTRCINEVYYNKRADIIAAGRTYDNEAARDSGGLAPTSKWYINTDYANEIQNAFNVLKNDNGYKQIWTFSHDDILAAQEFIRNNGIGKTKDENALQDFYNEFSHLAE